MNETSQLMNEKVLAQLLLLMVGVWVEGIRRKGPYLLDPLYANKKTNKRK